MASPTIEDICFDHTYSKEGTENELVVLEHFKWHLHALQSQTMGSQYWQYMSQPF